MILGVGAMQLAGPAMLVEWSGVIPRDYEGDHQQVCLVGAPHPGGVPVNDAPVRLHPHAHLPDSFYDKKGIKAPVQQTKFS